MLCAALSRTRGAGISGRSAGTGVLVTDMVVPRFRVLAVVRLV